LLRAAEAAPIRPRSLVMLMLNRRQAAQLADAADRLDAFPRILQATSTSGSAFSPSSRG
jgi:hypothetical protein